MDPELIEQTQDDAAQQAAFNAAFENAQKGMQPDLPPAPEPKAPEARTEEDQPAAAAPVAAPAEAAAPAAADPYADLPAPVRELIAEFGTVKHELKTVAGRNAALQRELDKLRNTAAAPVAAPAPAVPRAKRDQVAQELPEVAEALDEVREYVDQMVKAKTTEQQPPAAPQGEADDPEIAVLNEERSTWAQDIQSTEFQLWLGRQPADYQNRVRTTTRAAVLVGALSKFDQFRSVVDTRMQAAAEAARKRQDRAAAAVTPQGSGARGAPNTAMTEDEAFAAAFNSVRRGGA